MAIYLHYDKQTGRILGFYDSEINDNIPKDVIEITKEIRDNIITNSFNYYNEKSKEYGFKEYWSEEERVELERIRIKKELKRKINKIMFSNILNKEINIDIRSILNIDNLLLTLDDNETINFRCADNSFVEVNKQKLQEVRKEIAKYIINAYNEKWIKENNIK